MFSVLLAMKIGAEGAAALVIKCLAVAGGFLIGYFLGKFAAWALDRWVFANKAPDQLKKLVSLVAGTAFALLVAMLVFGEGGSGLFGGSGDGQGKGQPTPADNGKAPSTPEPKDAPPPKKDEPTKPVDPPKPTPGDIHVAILSGNEVKDGRFYLIENDPTPKTFEEFKDDITARRKASKIEVIVVFRFKKEPLAESNLALRRLDAWMKEVKLSNRFE